jgi:hypothetical protein
MNQSNGHFAPGFIYVDPVIRVMTLSATLIRAAQSPESTGSAHMLSAAATLYRHFGSRDGKLKCKFLNRCIR